MTRETPTYQLASDNLLRGSKSLSWALTCKHFRDPATELTRIPKGTRSWVRGSHVHGVSVGEATSPIKRSAPP